MKRGYTLLELLCTTSIIAILVALLLPVAGRVLRSAKCWIAGAQGHKANQLEVFLRDNAHETEMLFWTTNKVKPWSYITVIEHGTNAPTYRINP